MPYRYIKPLVRDDTLTHDEFHEHWQNANLHLADLDGLIQYRKILPTKPEDAEFDGIAELQFTTLEALYNAFDMNGGHSATHESLPLEDEATDLFDQLPIKETPEIFGEEKVEKYEVEGNTGGLYKHSAFLNRKDGMSHEEFYTYWADEHAPIAQDVSGVVRYVRVIPPAPERAAFDGVAELYFESLDELRAALGDESSRDYDPDDPTARALREDAENLHSIDRPRFIGRELVRINRL